MKSLLYILLTSLALYSCIGDSVSINQSSNAVPNEYGDMHLYHLSVGDEFYFGKYTPHFRSTNDSIPFTGDTMVLRVKNLQNDTITWDAEFRVKEGLSEMINGVLVPVRDTTIELTWCVNGNQLINLSETRDLKHLIAEDPLYNRDLSFNYSRNTEYEMNGGKINILKSEPNMPPNTSGFMLGGREYHYLKDTMNADVYCICPVNGIGVDLGYVYSLDIGLINSHIDGYKGWFRIRKPL